MEILFKLVILFVVGWALWSILLKAGENEDKKMQRRKETDRRIALETLYVMSEEVPYKDEKVFLGMSIIEKKFLGQGPNLQAMFERIFDRFPNKKTIVYYPKGLESGPQDKPVIVNRNDFDKPVEVALS